MRLFRHQKAVVGMIHVDALPGTPRNQRDIKEIVQKARAEAQTYARHGMHMLAIENMHDIPYLNREVGPEIVASMTAVALAVRDAVSLPVGIQILAGANKAALGVALAAGLDFIRAEGFCFGHLADEGLMDADAGPLLRYRRQIGAEHIKILADIKKKHSAHALSADVSIAETARAVSFFCGDGVIVTGSSTGEVASLAELEATRNAVELPVLVGSGVTDENFADYFAFADALIVGSYFKKDGNWQETVDGDRVSRFMDKVTAWKESI